MKCQVLLFKKSKKNINSLSSAEFAHSMLSAKKRVFDDNFGIIFSNLP